MTELKIGNEKVNSTNFGDFAEKAIRGINHKPFVNSKREEQKITTSKIRGILELVNKVYNRVINTNDVELSENILADIAYIKVKIAYESGREPVVKDFIQRTAFTAAITDVMNQRTRESFLLFARYVESLIAYFKFYGGKDQ